MAEAIIVMHEEHVTILPPDEITAALQGRKIEKDADGTPITFDKRIG